MKNILITLPVLPEHKKTFQEAAPECNISYVSERPPTLEDMVEANIIVGAVPAQLLKHCKKLELLQLNSAGTNDYVNPGVLPEGTALTCASGAYGLAISEYLLAALLCMQKKLHLYHDNQKRGEWKREGLVRSVYGSAVLIVGAGDIGSEFAKRIKALGGYTIGIRRTPSSCPDCLDELYTLDKLNELLPRADVVALTLPSTAATYHIMNHERLCMMKQGSYLLNVGRGTAIDTDALCRVMAEGRLGGAALDVTDPEPLPHDHPLWSAPNVYITPHVSGAYYLPETLNRVVNISAQNISHHLKVEPLSSVVDLETGYRRK